MDAAPNQLLAEGVNVREKDMARLSPLRFNHSNMLGRYVFTSPDASSGRCAIFAFPATKAERTFGLIATRPRN